MNQTRSRVTTHVLDAALGRPAQGVPVRLEQRVGSGWSAIATGSTNSDGRVTDFGPADLDAGVYRVSFELPATSSPPSRSASIRRWRSRSAWLIRRLTTTSRCC